MIEAGRSLFGFIDAILIGDQKGAAIPNIESMFQRFK
jgi:hypothetical protein